MTRQEALERLEGTWSFEPFGGRVMIREPSLIAAVAVLRRERHVHEPATASGPTAVAPAAVQG